MYFLRLQASVVHVSKLWKKKGEFPTKASALNQEVQHPLTLSLSVFTKTLESV